MSIEEESLRDDLFVIKLRELLDERNSEEATRHFEKGTSQGSVENCLWEILPIFFAHLSIKDKFNDPVTFATCEQLLEFVAKNCNAKETILLILEHCESSQDEVTFRSLLKPLRESLLRVGPTRSIDWCATSIRNYIKALPCPENEKPNNDAEAQTSKATIERLTLDYEAVLAFLKPFVELSALPKKSEIKTRNHLLGLHLSLFGAPFCYLLHQSKRSKKVTNSSSLIFEKTLEQMRLLTGDFFKYHGIIEEKSRRGKRESIEENDEGSEENATKLLRNKKNVSILAWANFYYWVLNSEEGLKNVPLVYDYRYLIRGCFYLANFMLNQAEYVLVTKGLKIVDSVLQKIDEYSLDQEILEFPIHHDLFASLTRVMIYCDSDFDRKFALTIFRDYIERFTYRARYLLLMHLYETANHSGIYSLLTSITKASIIHCLENVPRLNYFLGTRLERLIKRICRLPNGASSDLVEISDETISALNLVRFLVIRDRDDTTGIWKIVFELETNYLKPLREGIDLSLAHWRVKVKDLEEFGKNEDPQIDNCQDGNIAISVGGQTLPIMPNVEKIKFCRQAISALDVMESILIRVNECIKEHAERNKIRSLIRL